MKILLAGATAMAAILTGCAGNSLDTFDRSDVAANDGPEQYLVEEQPDGTVKETMWCGPYLGQGTATVRVVRPHNAQQACSYYKNIVIEFLRSDDAYSASGSGVIDGWDCQSYGWVKTGKLGYALECSRAKESIYLDVNKYDTGEPDFP